MSDQNQTADSVSSRPYQVLLFVGAPGDELPAIDGVRVADLTVADPFSGGSDPVLAALERCGLTPADLRTRTLFCVSPSASPAAAVAAYAAAVAFAGRRLDAACGDSHLDAASLDARTRAQSFPERPTDPPEELQVGAAHPELPTVGEDGRLSPDDAATLRFARRVRMVPAPQPLAAIAQFLVVAALRARPGDRFPLMVRGDEPVRAPAAVSDGEGVEADPPVGVDLDELRRSAMELRRSLRFEDRSSLAEPVELTDRQRDMLAAAALPAEAVLVALGTSTPGTGLWHCPRPDRHRNGDANASMRVDGTRSRCFRCDPEKVDPVRLVADVQGWSFDEAAAWLLAAVASRVDELCAAAAAMMPAVDDGTGHEALPA